MPVALEAIDSVQVYDNSEPGRGPELVMETQSGSMKYLAEKTPDWLEKALWGTDYEINEELRAQAREERDPRPLGFDR